MITPAQLGPGSRIRAVAPSSPYDSPRQLKRGIEVLEGMGYAVEVDPRSDHRWGYLAGGDRERARAIEDAFRDPDVDGVMAIGGGYGAARTVEHLDFSAVAEGPKAFVGFSDVTFLHMAILRETGLQTFYGPTVKTLARARPATIASLRRALESGGSGVVPTDPEALPIGVLTEGEAEGPLTGGCLTLVAATLGTPFEIETDGRILFIEDVGEEPHAVDRMLTQLRQAGKLSGVRGVVVGELEQVGPRPHHPSFPHGALPVEAVLADRLGGLGVPVIYGHPIGHGAVQATLRYGAPARISGATFEIL